MLTQHLEHFQQLLPQQMLLSCSAQIQEIRLFQNQLHKSYQLPLTVCPFSPLVLSPLSASNDPGFSSLAFLPLFSRKKFTSYFSHTVTGERDLQGDYSNSKTKVVRQRTVSLHFASRDLHQGSHFPHNFTNIHQCKKCHSLLCFECLCSKRQARKLWGKDCLTMSTHDTMKQHSGLVPMINWGTDLNILPNE